MEISTTFLTFVLRLFLGPTSKNNKSIIFFIEFFDIFYTINDQKVVVSLNNAEHRDKIKNLLITKNIKNKGKEKKWLKIPRRMKCATSI